MILLTFKTKRRVWQWRRFWLAAHLYLGLSTGLIFVLAGLTGSLLVFYVELDEIVNPGLQISPELARQQPQSFETLLQAIRHAHPEKTGAWRLEIPRHSQAMMMARYYKAKEKEHVHFAPLMVWVNPYSGEVVSSRFWGDYLMTWIYDLHYELLLDKTGKIIMGIVGLLLLTLVLAGVYLWWPKAGKFKTALTFKAHASQERFNYDLHKISGIYGFALMFLLLFSGVVLELPDYINPVINRLSPLYEPGNILSRQNANQPRISADLALARASTAFPGAQLRWLETPSNSQDAYNFRFYQDGEPSIRFPKSVVWVDQYTGNILKIRNPNNDNGGDTFLSWMHPLHSGEIAGLTGRIMVAISGILPAILFYTGFVRWRQKRRVKRLKQALSN